MARTVGKLTTLFVRGVNRPGLYPDGGGLYLQVGDGAAKSWIYRYRVSAREHYMGLGPARDIPLAEARELARE